MNPFKNGDSVYSDDGRLFEYVASAPDGHIVRALYGHDDYPNETLGDPEILRNVYPSPPEQKLDKEIADYRTRLQSARTELEGVENEIAAATRQRDAMLKEFAKHPMLAPVLAWMRGEITHLVTIGSYGSDITIKPVAEALMPSSADDRRNGEVRLLALYGGYTGPEKRKGSYPTDNLKWQLNAYRDGSGSNVTCLLATSEDDAKVRLQEWLDHEFAKRDECNHHVYWARAALKLGLRVPEKLASEVSKQDESQLAHNLAQANRYLADAQKNVATYTQQIADLQAKKATA